MGLRNFTIGIAALLSACGGDDAGGSGGSGGGGGSGGSGGATIEGCDVVVDPGDDDTTTVQTALIDVKSGQTVCLTPGTFSFEKELSLTAPNVTLRGTGDAIGDVVLDFADQTEGDDGVTVTADGFTVENFWIKNTPGNGIVVTGAKDVTFRKLKVTWDAGSVVTNGAYSIYPAECENVIVEDCEVVGAADAGIYVGQATNAIVRRNVAWGNVAGIEVENSTNSEVYENHTYDNTVGIFLPLLPNLKKKELVKHLVHDNITENNNRANFAEPGSTIEAVPAGLGMLFVAGDEIEIRDNEIKDNDTSAIGIFTHDTFVLLVPGGMADPEEDGYAEKYYIHGNTFTNNGSSPQGIASVFMQPTLEDVIWDGGVRMGTTAASLEICLGTTNVPSFRNLDVAGGFMNQTTDTTAHECELSGLPAVSF